MNKTKSVICDDTGKIYRCGRTAALELNLDPSSISKCCQGKLKKVGGLSFHFIDNGNIILKPDDKLLSEISEKTLLIESLKQLADDLKAILKENGIVEPNEYSHLSFKELVAILKEQLKAFNINIE